MAVAHVNLGVPLGRVRRLLESRAKGLDRENGCQRKGDLSHGRLFVLRGSLIAGALVADILFYPAFFFKHYFVPNGGGRLLLCLHGAFFPVMKPFKLASSFAPSRLRVRLFSREGAKGSKR
ncbi:MAG TPA: hypothetical protein VD861_07140 [Pyrinomonadaceae bacterium]|nr:hypothetical protein [Pyrinomonadaceae bacterium]